MPRGRKVLWAGYKVHIIKARNSLNIGANIYGRKFACWGKICSLRNSFRASARG